MRLEKYCYRTAPGTHFKKTSVEMVQMVESPEWTEHSVHVKLLLDWSF